MASGDTKTEALLNILGNGGSGDEYRGCCNTKTQQYILDAIDRINEIQPGGDAAFTILTDDDANYTHPDEPDTPYIALWLLPAGKYMIDKDATIAVLPGLFEGAIGDMYYAHQNPIFLSNNSLEPNSETDIHALQAEEAIKYIVAIDDGEIDERNAYTQPFVGTDGVDPGASGLVPIPEATDADKFLKSDGTWSTAGGGAVVKTLTTADYNYPANNPDGISPGLLDEGFYQVEDDNVYVYAPSRAKNFQKDLFFVFRTDGNGLKRAICIRPEAEASTATHIVTIYGYDGITGWNHSWETRNLADEYELSTIRTIIKTVAPTTSTVGEVGQFYLDTTNTKLYICLSAQGGTYTWHEVTLS